ncbi:MAG: YqgE/AlgH family protein [Bryobacteraceae bacterium]|jgi:putative transcriptional regulator
MPFHASGMRLLAAACLALALPLWAADAPALPATGKLLVATRKMRDADFAQAVILLVHSDAQGVIGLIVNRLTEVPLAHLFPSLKDAPAGKAPVYLGGLVAQGARGLVLSGEKNPPKTSPEKTPDKTPDKTRDALPVFGRVSVISDATALEKMALSGARRDMFRVYAGYTGWSAEQLRNELKFGYWTIATATESIVFDPHPETLWRRLTGQTHPVAARPK